MKDLWFGLPLTQNFLYAKRGKDEFDSLIGRSYKKVQNTYTIERRFRVLCVGVLIIYLPNIACHFSLPIDFLV